MSYATLDPNAFGTCPTPPAPLARLPFDLNRTSLITRDPGRMALAAEAFRAAMQAQEFNGAMLMPQRMMFQQWKRMDNGASRGDLRPAMSSAESASGAMMPPGLSGATLRTLRVPESVPTYAMARAALERGSAALPVPEYAPVPAGAAGTPRVRPTNQPVRPPLEAYGAAIRAVEDSHASARAADTAAAFASVAQVRAGIRQLIGF